MKPECAAAARAAAGNRQLTDADLRAIETRLQSSSKAVRHADPQAWQGMSPAERLQAAAKHARETHLAQIATGHAAALRRVQVKLRNDALIDALPAGKQLDGIDVNTFLVHGKSTMNPVEARDRALTKWMYGHFTGADERLMDDPAKRAAFADEFYGKDSGDAAVRAVVRKFQAMNDATVERLQRAGVHITAKDDWHVPQPWDWTRIPDRETYVQKMLAWIDPREFTNADGTPQSAEQLRHTLEAAWLTQKTNGANKRAENPGRGHSTGLNAKYSAQRVLQFKDGASWLAAMQEFGEFEHIGGIVRAHMRSRARDIALAEQHGPMADTDFRERIARAEANDKAVAGNEREARKAERKARTLLAKWDVMTRGPSPGNVHVAAWMGAIRSVLSASKLGVLVSQQPSDALMSLNFLKAIGMKTGHFAQDMAAGVIPSAERDALMRAAGAWMDSMHEAVARFGETEVLNGVSRFMNGTVYKWSGMRAADRATTYAHAGSFYGTLGEHLQSGKAFDAIPAASREFLQRHGMTAELWDVLRKVDIAALPGDGRAFLNPADVYSIPDAALRDLAERRVAGTNAELKARIDQLHAANEREAGWTAKRAAKLADLRERITATIRELETKEAVRAEKAEGVAAARAELLRAKLQRAEVEADIARYLDTRDQQARVSDAIDRATDDDNVAPFVQRFAQKVGTKGEGIGRLRANVEARITAAEKALADREAATSANLDARQDAADKMIAGHAKELDEFAQRMRARAGRRDDLAAAYRDRVRKAVADETARIRDEVVGNLLGAFEDISHAAGRGFAPSSITERQRLLLNQTEPGSITGEAMRMFYMIRQVPFGLVMTHMHDVPAGMDGWAPRAQYVVKYMLGQAIATGVAIELKHLIAGEDPENPATMVFAGRMLAGAGIGPLLATLLFGSGGEDNDPMGKVFGPAADFAATGISLAQSIRDDMDKEKPVDWGKVGNRAVSLARSNAVPFGNFWYTKAAFNHLVYQQLQEMVSPGYNERVRQRLGQRGTTQWWHNGDTAPQRAPDLGAIVGQPPE